MDLPLSYAHQQQPPTILYFADKIRVTYTDTDATTMQLQRAKQHGDIRKPQFLSRYAYELNMTCHHAD